ncbi:VCBS repeat-containing protein [Breoghania sp.]|uniref:FG-GAP repeat domain-containing protein n=1 Tax=Breoghania sp. TaxID=2065378 RepID=UPI002AA6A691|nr:VCBS repeat-containing protein [Breoghania sp.]
MAITRWEDDASVWNGPDYTDQNIRYAPDVETSHVNGRIITCVEVVDWDGDGGRDLLLSSWDACYDGKVYLRQQIGTNADGTPILGPEELVPGVRGYVTAVRDGDVFHLISTSRLRKTILVYPNKGTPIRPDFGDPFAFEPEADWVKGNEYFHLARFVDLDGTGEMSLVVGTDCWDEYWPNGLEWNDAGYKAYDAAGRWLGGPLRGYLYTFRNHGTVREPKLARGNPVTLPVTGAERPLEVYGQLAPAFGPLAEGSRLDVVCGEFWNVLHIARDYRDGGVASTGLVETGSGAPLELQHCIYLPCIVDWNDNGRPDILVGAEDGYVSFLQNLGRDERGMPRFQKACRVQTTAPNIHASVLPVPAAFDFNGNGLQDLVVGNCRGELLFYPNRGPADAPALGHETHLQAGGEDILVSAGPTGSIQGPSEKMFGYTCPTIADWDGDGLPDILMSDVTGHHVFYRNEGGSYPPSFKTGQKLTHEGRPLKTVWRVRPAVVDWLGNGTLHYLTLDEEGCLADYRRESDTVLADKRLLHREDGAPIRFTEDVGGGRGRIKLCVCDWTGSGRYDLIIGTHARASVPPGPGGQPRHSTKQAGIFLLRNTGSNEKPRFAAPEPFRFKGELISLGMHACAPEAVDWTGSGELGLVVGVEDGSLVWFAREHLSWDNPD